MIGQHCTRGQFSGTPECGLLPPNKTLLMSPDEKHVVIAEDDVGMSQAVERLLCPTGFQVITFRSAEALLVQHEVLQPAWWPTFVFLDFLALSYISDSPSLEVRRSIIFMTAHDKPINRDRAREAGAIAYFTKPFQGSDLIAAVASALGCAMPPELHATRQTGSVGSAP